MEIGKFLKFSRKEKGMSLVELSKESGVSHPYLSQIENGKFTPSPDILGRLSGALNLRYLDLMVLAGHIPEKEKADREWEDLLYGPDSVAALNDIRDLELALTVFAGTLRYNGHKLTKQDCQRVLDMLKAMFPEYQNKGE